MKNLSILLKSFLIVFALGVFFTSCSEEDSSLSQVDEASELSASDLQNQISSDETLRELARLGEDLKAQYNQIIEENNLTSDQISEMYKMDVSKFDELFSNKEINALSGEFINLAQEINLKYGELLEEEVPEFSTLSNDELSLAFSRITSNDLQNVEMRGCSWKYYPCIAIVAAAFAACEFFSGGTATAACVWAYIAGASNCYLSHCL